MPLLPTPTILDSGLLAGAEAANHLASVISSQWSRFWNRDPEVVAAELNADPQRSGQIFALNGQAAQAVNALLDAMQDARFSRRAPAAMPEHWSVGADGFVFTTPVIEEPTTNEP